MTQKATERTESEEDTEGGAAPKAERRRRKAEGGGQRGLALPSSFCAQPERSAGGLRPIANRQSKIENALNRFALQLRRKRRLLRNSGAGVSPDFGKARDSRSSSTASSFRFRLQQLQLPSPAPVAGQLQPGETGRRTAVCLSEAAGVEPAHPTRIGFVAGHMGMAVQHCRNTLRRT